MTEPVTLERISTAFDLSSRRISQLAEKGIVVRVGRGRFDLDASTLNYIRHLREVAAGRGEGAPDLTAERARLAKEQADGHALKNATIRGSMIDAAEASSRWAGEMVKLRSRLLAVPGDVSLVLPHLTKHDVYELDRALRDAMTAVAEGAA